MHPSRLIISISILSAACESAPPEPAQSRPTAEPIVADAKPATPPAVRPPPPAPKPTGVPVAPDDPLAGKFTLEDATKGLAGNGPLVAEIQTGLGKLSCELFSDKAPITVANFVGLARGLRPFKSPTGEWVKKPGYDGTTFHRVIKGFMIQGGDPLGSGAGEPGYVIADEIWEGAKHDRRGLLCMANRGKNTNGMQFFITDGAPTHLDGGYTIFGECKPGEVIEKLASVEVRGDRAVKPTKIEKVTIKRASAKPGTPAATPSVTKPPAAPAEKPAAATPAEKPAAAAPAATPAATPAAPTPAPAGS
jgi:peptidyl-prolyl cis-trans isomerase A (cyclophilin A)